LAHGIDVAVTSNQAVSFARSTPTSPVSQTRSRSRAEAQQSTGPTHPFYGRTAEIVELTQHLTNPAARLITVVGPGGMGKPAWRWK
jgi:hypothetical protein